MTWKGRLALWTVIAFAAFYLFTQPENAANAVGGLYGLVTDGFTSFGTFLATLFN